MKDGNHSDRTPRPPLLAIAIPLALYAVYLLGHYGWALFT